jgi:hypothetical protein
MSQQQPESEADCSTEAIQLLNCLAADQYIPEDCQIVFTSFRKCIFANRILEFGVIGSKLDPLEPLPHITVQESPKQSSSCKS